MAVEQAGQDGAPVQVDDARPGAALGQDGAIASDGSDAPRFHRDGLLYRESRIHRDDPAVVQDQVRIRAP